ncbi:unnamed protein product [Mortierella alpina]
MVVFLLREITKRIAGSIARVQDNDGEFLLIEAADFIPSWLDPDNSDNRVFIHGGQLHIIPIAVTAEEKKRLPTAVGTRSKSPSLQDALDLIRASSNCQTDPAGVEDSQHGAARAAITTLASPNIQQAAFGPLLPDSTQQHFALRKIQEQRHYATCQIPVDIAWILKARPELVTRAAEAFYTRDALAMATCSRMTKFLPATKPSSSSSLEASLVPTTTAGATGVRELGKNKTLFVTTSVCFTKTCYAQLMGQQFQPPKIWDGIVPLSDSVDADNSSEKAKEAELGMKLTCGFEILCSPDYPGDFGFQSADEIRLEDFPFATDESWRLFKSNLASRKYFGDERPGSQKYQELELAAKHHFLENKAAQLQNADIPGTTTSTTTTSTTTTSTISASLHGHLYHPVHEIDRILSQGPKVDDLEMLIDDRKSDDDSWMNVDLQVLEDMMRARGFGGGHSETTEQPSKSGLDMQQMLDRFGEFIQEGEGGIEGAEFLDEQSEDEQAEDDDDDMEEEHAEDRQEQGNDADEDEDDDDDDVFASDYEERQAKKQAAKRGQGSAGGVFLFGTEAMAFDNGTASDIMATRSSDHKANVKGFAVDHGNFKDVLTRAFGTPSSTRRPTEDKMDLDEDHVESMDEDQDLQEYMKVLDAELSGTKVGQSFEKMIAPPKTSSPSVGSANKSVVNKGKERATEPKTPASATKTQEMNLEELMKEHMNRSRRGFSRQGPLPTALGYDAAAATFADDEDDDMEEDEEQYGETGSATATTARVMEMDEEDEEQEVDVDLNLAKNLLESFKSQGGLPGPGGNLLSRLGIVLPRDEEGEDDDEVEESAL